MPPRVVTVPFTALDHASSAEFEAWWQREDIQHGSDVVVDLAAVRLLCAAGIASLERLETYVVARGGTLAVSRATPLVMRVLAMFGADRRWSIERRGRPDPA